MNTERLTVDPGEAQKMLRKYQEHRAWSKPIDHEIELIYQHITKGKTVVRAIHSIIQAGLGDDHLPKLAIARADAPKCFLSAWNNGSCRMATLERVNTNTQRSRVFEFDRAFPGLKGGFHSSIVPHIPPDIRPRRGLANYHVLYEAFWSPEPPIDPWLLRRIGATDFWLVLGAWELTEIERAVLGSHFGRH